MRALVLALLLLAPPALAGQVTMAWAPRDGREAALASAALSLYALSREGRPALRLDQRGRGNLARALQGRGDALLLAQRGEGHEATVAQGGGANALALVQLGRGARAAIAQAGGEAAVVVQLGW